MFIKKRWGEQYSRLDYCTCPNCPPANQNCAWKVKTFTAPPSGWGGGGVACAFKAGCRLAAFNCWLLNMEYIFQSQGRWVNARASPPDRDNYTGIEKHLREQRATGMDRFRQIVQDVLSVWCAFQRKWRLLSSMVPFLRRTPPRMKWRERFHMLEIT